jgi:hypothetical protein
VRKPFLVCWKIHPPLVYKIWVREIFSLFYIISTQRSYIHQKLDTNSCFAKLRANSYLFSFFYTRCIYIIYLFFLAVLPRPVRLWNRQAWAKECEQKNVSKTIMVLQSNSSIKWISLKAATIPYNLVPGVPKKWTLFDFM